MNSCVEELGHKDNPAPTPDSGQTGAVAKGSWWLNESYIDKTVKPGDNFYIYCIGTWWRNTVLPANINFVDNTYKSGKPTFYDRVKALTDANYSIYQNHLKWPNAATEAAAMKTYQDVVAKRGLLETKTPEDVMRAFGRLGTLGVATCLALEPFCHNDKIAL